MNWSRGSGMRRRECTARGFCHSSIAFRMDGRQRGAERKLNYAFKLKFIGCNKYALMQNDGNIVVLWRTQKHTHTHAYKCIVFGASAASISALKCPDVADARFLSDFKYYVHYPPSTPPRHPFNIFINNDKMVFEWRRKTHKVSSMSGFGKSVKSYGDWRTTELDNNNK